MSDVHTGTVKFFNESKGFGFITPDNPQSKDAFVHISAVNKAGLGKIKEGDRLQYTLENQKGKVAAGNLKRAA